ncbi:hypothetical protein [Nocardioides ferulae]|uniref:hypothetical protein n=1 Tax=Nocardioides ferulae TaxID=2340821 RepID=UPI000F87D285|nr:hypothetical protein [Nocardioides ferulae]
MSSETLFKGAPREAPRGAWREVLRHWLAEHPRVTLAAKTAIAAGIAWIAVRQAGGWLADYPYYAPLGAVVAVTNTVARSLREGGQAVTAILLGASLAFSVRLLDLPVVVSLAVVVGAGTLLAGLPFLRSMGSWVPVSGLFVLLVGGSDPVHYPLAYLGLTALGGAIGLAVNLLFPPLPLLRTERTEQRMRSLLAEQLDALADGLLCEEELTDADWARRRRDLLPGVRKLEEVIGELSESRHGNWRVQRWQDETDQHHAQARALQQLSLLVEDVSSLVTARGHLLRTCGEGGPSLQEPAGHALQETAALLRSLDGPTAEPEPLLAADSAVQRLATAIREQDAGSRRDGFAAASIVTSIRRALASLAPEELVDRVPSNW